MEHAPDPPKITIAPSNKKKVNCQTTIMFISINKVTAS